jgi:hypothetical protein
MRKQILFSIFVLLFIHSSHSKNVTKEQAVAFAATEIKSREASFERLVQNVQPVYVENQPVYYIINYVPQGWALISADDVTAPLLAYSCEGRYVRENQPETMQAWLNGYGKQVFELMKKTGLTRHAGWDHGVGLRSSAGQNAVGKINPLISVEWNQTSPYNTSCPSNANGRALVGCVAVAMAQAMTVSRTPDRPKGYASYNSDIYGALGVNYDAEVPYNWNSIMTGANNKSEVARLLYHCGISVKMTYSSTGSGAYTSAVASALKQYFSYSSSVKYYSRFSGSTEWENLLLAELQAGRPVVYGGNDGTGVAGHCFNLDGYDGASMYHVNWGWGGSNNGYYRIDNLHDQYANYTQGHEAVVGIKSIYYGPSDITLSNASIREGLDVGTTVGTITVESEVNPENGYDYELKGAYNIFLDDYMPAAFYVENNELKSKEIFTYSNIETTKTVYIKAINRVNRLSHEKMFNISVLKNTGIRPLESTENIQVYSENQRLYIAADKPCKYALYTLTGQKIMEASLPAGKNLLSNRVATGCYLTTIIYNDNIYIKKICL